MRTLNVYAYGISRLIGYYPYLCKAKKILKTGDLEATEKYIMKKINWATKQVLKKSGVELDVQGRDNVPENEPVIFICNHQGNYDAIVLMAALENKRIGFISKKEIQKIGILSMWMEVIGCVFIDRKNARTAFKSISDSADNVTAGTCMAFFPEGTRSKSSNVAEFKTGVFKVVEKTKAKVIPVSINGTYKVLEANNGKIKPAGVTVTIGKPIDTSSYEKKDFKELPNKVRDIIIENMREPKNI